MAKPARKEIPYNRRVMKWARERRRLRLEDAARKVNVAPERLAEWERDDASDAPTIRQARALADFYHRPFLEFFSPGIPVLKEPELAPDFRFHRIAPGDDEITGLFEIQKWAEEIRLNTLDLFELIGEPARPFPSDLYCEVHEDVDLAAARVRERMLFPTEMQTALRAREREAFPSMLRRKLESLGILVLKHSGLQKYRTRGVCLYDEVLPLIVFGSESAGATAFTLTHEFAHILLAQSAFSAYPRFGKGSDKKKIEGWCNRFAAAFLMPREAIVEQMRDFPKRSASVSDATLRDLANLFAVSPHAALIRLVNLDFVDPSFYWRVKRPQFIKQEQEFKGFGRAPYYGSRYRNRHGDLYTGLVLEAWGAGRITNHSAAEFMGIKKLDHLNDIRSNFQHPNG
jgi:Zn-dependent peptidase ImmA (M78 family)/DNA-binding XRE family transcriptional regulator